MTKKLILAMLLLFSSLAAMAAPAAPVTVTSIGVVSSTVTITATAHGILANRGFCITNTAFCGTAASVTANTIVFTSSGVPACAASCGTVSAAKQIVALQISMPPNQSATFICWLTTASPVTGTAQSQWSGASVAEKNAIGAGTTIEFSPGSFPVNGATLASFKAYAQKTCGDLQTSLDSGVSPAFLFGNYYDGTGWLN